MKTIITRQLEKRIEKEKEKDEEDRRKEENALLYDKTCEKVQQELRAVSAKYPTIFFLYVLTPLQIDAKKKIDLFMDCIINFGVNHSKDVVSTQEKYNLDPLQVLKWIAANMGRRLGKWEERGQPKNITHHVTYVDDN